MIDKISAVTLRVANMEASVRFYKDVIGLKIIYGGEGSDFTSLRAEDGDAILNHEHGNAGAQCRTVFGKQAGRSSARGRRVCRRRQYWLRWQQVDQERC
jgi:catechol 2,3-dioxygenase-like lactoylglutathione lyase family enzyme